MAECMELIASRKVFMGSHTLTYDLHIHSTHDHYCLNPKYDRIR